MPSTDTSRMRVPVAGDEKCSVPDAGQPVAGAPKGNKNGFKHGLYTAEAIVRRRKIAQLIRSARELIG